MTILADTLVAHRWIRMNLNEKPDVIISRQRQQRLYILAMLVRYRVNREQGHP
jgi:hypothetical protein